MSRCTCAACGEVFVGVGAFDAHREGRYRDGRRCRSPEALLAAGWERTDKGIWRKPSKTHPEPSGRAASSTALLEP